MDEDIIWKMWMKAIREEGPRSSEAEELGELYTMAANITAATAVVDMITTFWLSATIRCGKLHFPPEASMYGLKFKSKRGGK